jgi:hypothetical protein
MRHQNALKDGIKVHVPASNRYNRALLEVCANTGDLTKTFKNGRQIIDVFLQRSHKHHRIIRIERSPKDCSPPPKIMKKTMPSSTIKDLVERVDGKNRSGDRWSP